MPALSVFNRTRIVEAVADAHAIEGFELEQRRVMGAPSVTIRCRCGEVCDLHSYADHVALVAVRLVEDATP